MLYIGTSKNSYEKATRNNELLKCYDTKSVYKIMVHVYKEK